MLICPVCKTQYEDDTLKTCVNDGTDLVAAPKLEDNPPLPEVVPAPPDAITSDFDIEAVQHEYQKLEISDSNESPSQPIPEVEPAPEAPLPISEEESKKKPGPPILRMVIAFFLIIAVSFATYFWFRERDLVQIELRSNPEGAKVLLDGKEIGRSPLRVQVQKGVHQVVFEYIGYTSVNETIVVSSEGHVVAKTMVPLSPPEP